MMDFLFWSLMVICIAIIVILLVAAAGVYIRRIDRALDWLFGDNKGDNQ